MRKIGFIVMYVTPEHSGARIAGRCAYQAIQVGDVFTEVVTLARAVKDEDYAREPEVTSRKPVRLHVESITVYQRSIEELSPGWTAELTVSGDGLSNVSLGGVLLNEEA